PLTGPLGASHVYGPQKGADPATVALLDRALAHFADVVERDLGKRVADLPGAGAAGGAGAGLVAFLDAELTPGAPLIVTAAGFDSALSGADLVFTGEGRVDAQTAYGKAPGEVAVRADRCRARQGLPRGRRTRVRGAPPPVRGFDLPARPPEARRRPPGRGHRPGNVHEGAADDGPRRRLLQLRRLGPHRRAQPLL